MSPNVPLRSNAFWPLRITRLGIGPSAAINASMTVSALAIGSKRSVEILDMVIGLAQDAEQLDPPSGRDAGKIGRPFARLDGGQRTSGNGDRMVRIIGCPDRVIGIVLLGHQQASKTSALAGASACACLR